MHLAAKQAAPPLLALLLKHSAQVQAKMAPTGETARQLVGMCRLPEPLRGSVAAASGARPSLP